MKRLSALVISLGVLAGCASTIEGQQQTVRLLTPGAENAECVFHNRDMQFTLRTGENRVINKSDRDLTADCRAPGNRQRSVVVSPQLEPMTLGNAATGVVPGVAYDHLAKGMYVYPETITVDFSGIPASAYPLPDYMRPEVRNVYHGEIERYGNDNYRLPGEYPVPAMIQKRTDGNGITGNPFEGGQTTPTPASQGAPFAPRPVPVTEK